MSGRNPDLYYYVMEGQHTGAAERALAALATMRATDWLAEIERKNNVGGVPVIMQEPYTPATATYAALTTFFYLEDEKARSIERAEPDSLAALKAARQRLADCARAMGVSDEAVVTIPALADADAAIARAEGCRE